MLTYKTWLNITTSPVVQCLVTPAQNQKNVSRDQNHVTVILLLTLTQNLPGRWCSWCLSAFRRRFIMDRHPVWYIFYFRTPSKMPGDPGSGLWILTTTCGPEMKCAGCRGLASDWSMEITWPQYWPLIGCRGHSLNIVTRPECYLRVFNV